MMQPLATGSEDIEDFAIRVRALANSHEVRFIGDGVDLIDRLWPESIGLDPNDILYEPSPLAISTGIVARSAVVAQCSCGVRGCCDVKLEVRAEGERVLWVHGPHTLRFRAAPYEVEVTRAQADTSWETPERTAARLVRTRVDRPRLAKHGLTFGWASGRVAPDTFTLSLQLDPGPYQVLVALPWRNHELAVTLAESALDVLRSDPRSWTDARYLPQRDGLGPPALRGPGWRHWDTA